MNRQTTALIVTALLATSASCLRKTEFRCDTSTECGAGLTCESTGYCSFADSECQRYSESAGPLAGQCVGSTNTDAGVDIDGAVSTDGAMPDGPVAGCPAGYEEVGALPHRYRFLMNVENWETHRGACAATSSSAYLAIPDDADELMQLAARAGGTFWVGVQDMDTEGTYVTVRNTPQTFLPWAGGEPNNGGPGEGSDCVAANNNSQFLDERCNTKYRAVCECEP